MSARVGCLLLLALGTAPLEAAPVWTPAELVAAPVKELEDLQSPLHLHEHVARGVLRIAGEGFTFAEGVRKEVAWSRDTAGAVGDKRASTGRVRSPAYVTLPVAAERTYAVRVRVEGRLLVSSTVGVRLPAGGYLVDSDLDGELGTSGDGYVAPQSRTVGPWSGEVWTAKGGTRYRRRDQGGWECSAIELPHPGNADHVKAWCLLQWRRQQCGCLPLEYDVALEDGMRKHAAYLALHPEDAHVEDPAKTGFSPEGEHAARNCIIGHGDASMVTAMQMHFATMYHRTRPLQPGLMKSAMVFHQESFLFDVFTHRGGLLKDALLVYPPHGMEEVPTRFHPQGESPMPVDVEAHGNRLGTAVNVFSEPLRIAESLAEPPRLTLQQIRPRSRRDDGHVFGQVHFPGQPPSARAGASNRGCVALVPAAPLRPKSRFEGFVHVVLPGGEPFGYRWWFETAAEARRPR